jgi:ankyrin repeat protein
VQIFDDCRRLGSEPGCSIASARAAFHVSLAYFLGFGTEVDIHHGIEWASKSSFKGFQTASTFQELIEEAFLYDDTIGSCCSQERYRRFICEAFRKVDIPYLDAVPIKSSLTFEELVALRNANQHEAELTVSHWIEFPFVHYTVLYGLTSFLTPDDNINFVEPIMGETPLLLACRLGNTPAVRDLLLLGADCTISANDGCLPIHWLWMFPPEDIKFMATILLFPDQATGQYLASTVEGATLTRNFSSRSYTSHPSPVPPMSASSSTYESSKLKNAGILGFEFQLFRHKLAANKVFATAKGLARHKLISSISGRRYLDPQVPLQLVGTPLQFAIGVASKEAVDVLLYFGADPTFDSSVWLKLERDNWRDRSAIHLAASLHMANFLEMFRDLFVSRVDFFHSSWPAIAESSPFERTLIHGRHSLQAARDTIAFLRDNSFEPSLLHPRQVITNQRIIEVASEVHDFAILVAGLPQPELMGDESLGYQLSSADRDFLMLQCTKAACSGAYGLGKSMELLEFALSRGCSVDTSQDEIQEVRAFNIAIQYHRTEILDWFLEKGVNIKALDDSGSSPLHHMINSGFPGTSHLIKLLEAGADPNARGPLGATPLHVAVKNLNIKQASILLEHGADLTIPAIADYDPANSGESNTKCSILHCAVDTGSVELVSLILKYRDLRYPARADTLSWKDSQGNTPLLLAALRGDANMVNIILDNGEDRSVRNANDFNCLHAAASGLHGGVLSILAKKSDVNAVVRPTGETPLHLVFRASQDPASNLSLSCIMVLIDAGADMMICDHFGITFMDLVWSHFPRTDRADQTYIENRRKVLNKMTEQGCGISFDSHSNATMPMLHAAVAARNEGCIEELLMLGASVGILDSIGRTPLHRCASMGSRHGQTLSRHLDQKLYRVAELLIKGGADIYGLDAQGCIPLEVAIHSHNVPITTILLYRHKLGNGLLSVGASDVKITDSISEVTNYLAPSTKRNGGVVESIKKLLPVRKVKDIVTESPSLEVRLKNVAGVDRQILLKAWLLSIHVENWSCTSVFLQLGLFENTVLLKWPLGLGVLKYALEEEIGAVLIQFMGNLSQDPDPVLGDNWQHVVKMNEKWLAKNLGEHLIHRLTQLIKTKAYTPILDLESLRERDYIEAQNTSMIEVIPQVESPAQITLFNLEDEEEDYGLDEDIQFKLNKLIEKWKRNEGSFF